MSISRQSKAANWYKEIELLAEIYSSRPWNAICISYTIRGRNHNPWSQFFFFFYANGCSSCDGIFYSNGTVYNICISYETFTSISILGLIRNIYIAYVSVVIVPPWMGVRIALGYLLLVIYFSVISLLATLIHVSVLFYSPLFFMDLYSTHLLHETSQHPQGRNENVQSGYGSQSTCVGGRCVGCVMDIWYFSLLYFTYENRKSSIICNDTDDTDR